MSFSKTVIVSLGIILSSQGLGLNINCKEAGGYYGNLEVTDQGQRFKVMAAQGFSYVLSKQLGIAKFSPSAITYIDKKNCRFGKRQGRPTFYCRSTNQLVKIARDYGANSDTFVRASAFDFIVSEVSDQNQGGYFTRVRIQAPVNGQVQSAEAQFRFGGLGTCRFGK